MPKASKPHVWYPPAAIATNDWSNGGDLALLVFSPTMHLAARRQSTDVVLPHRHRLSHQVFKTRVSIFPQRPSNRASAQIATNDIGAVAPGRIAFIDLFGAFVHIGAAVTIAGPTLVAHTIDRTRGFHTCGVDITRVALFAGRSIGTHRCFVGVEDALRNGIVEARAEEEDRCSVKDVVQSH